MNGSNLKQRIAIGIAWMAGARAIVRFLGLASTLVLARLLTPVDFGLVAMATAVAAGLELLTLFGFDVALVQRERLDRAHYDSAWTLNLLLGVALGVAVILAAGPAAAFYREPRLDTVLVVIGAKYALLGAANPGVVDFRRNLEFGKEFGMQVGPKLLGIFVTIPLAFWLRDYRALIIGMVVTAFATCVFSYVMHPHRPRFCLSESGGLLRFSRWLLANNFMTFLRSRAADFIIGRALGPAALGTYSLSYEISNLPTTEMVAPINRVLLPGYVKVVGNPDQLRDSFRATLGLIAIAVLPASVGLAAVADPLVRVALGPQWLAAIPLIGLLAMAGAGNVLQTNTGAVHTALGQPRMTTFTGLIHVVTLLPMLAYGTYRFGLEGTAWAYVIHTFGPGIFTTYFIFLRTTPVKAEDLWHPVWRPTLAAPLMYLGVRRFLDAWPADDSLPGMLASLGAACVFGAFLYSLLVGMMWIIAGRPEATETALLRRIEPVWRRWTGRTPRVR